MNNKGFTYIEVLVSVTILVVASLGLLQAFMQSYKNIKFAKENYIIEKTSEMIIDNVKGKLLYETSFLDLDEFVFSPSIAESISRNLIGYNIFIKKLDDIVKYDSKTEIGASDYFFTNKEYSDPYLVSELAFADVTFDFQKYHNIFNLVELPAGLNEQNTGQTRLEYVAESGLSMSFSNNSKLEINSEGNDCNIRQLDDTFNEKEYIEIDLREHDSEFNFIIENYATTLIDILIVKNPDVNEINIQTRNIGNGDIFVNESFYSKDVLGNSNFTSYLIKVDVMIDNNSQSLVDILNVKNTGDLF